MKNKLKLLSIIAFLLAIPSLIITDQHYEGYGILVMFMFLNIGIIIDQVVRLKYPVNKITPISNYRRSKLLNIISLTLFLQSPMGLIYGNKIYNNLGIWLLIIMICIGVSIDYIARIKYPYKTQ